MTDSEKDQALRFIEYTDEELLRELRRRFPRGYVIARILDEDIDGERELIPYFDYCGDEQDLINLCADAIYVIKTDFENVNE